MAHHSISRRQFLQIIAVGGIAGLTTKFGLDALVREGTLSETRLLMGTVVNLKIVGADPEAARSAISACLDRMDVLETVFSRFQSESQLSRLNRDGFLIDADPALVEMLAESTRLSQITNGAFDVTVKPLLDLYQQARDQGTGLPPGNLVSQALLKVGIDKLQVSSHDIAFVTEGMGITVDGIAKGYIVDQGVAVLRQHGFANVMVEAGGDLLASGLKSSQKPWSIGINSPRETGTLLTKLDVTDKAIATSGDYMQPFSEDLTQHHILDPRSGYSAPELASATVIAPTAILADALATAVMVLGPSAGLALLDGEPGCSGYLVDKQLNTFQSTNI